MNRFAIIFLNCHFLTYLVYPGVGFQEFVEDCLSIPKQIENLIGTDLKNILEESGINLYRFNQVLDTNEYNSFLRSSDVIDPLSNQIIELQVRAIAKDNKFVFEIKCPKQNTCQGALERFKSEIPKETLDQFAMTQSNNFLQLELTSKAKNIDPEEITKFLNLKKLNQDHFLDLWSNNVKSIDVGHLNDLEVFEFINKGTSYTIHVPEFKYMSGGFSPTLITIPSQNRNVILEVIEPGTKVKKYGMAISQPEKDTYIVAIYDGNKINLVEKKIDEQVTDTYQKFNDISDIFYKLYLKTSFLTKNKNSSYRENLVLLDQETPLGSEDAIQMFQLRGKYVEHSSKRYPQFSPNMYSKLLDMPSNLTFEEVLQHAANVRRSAIDPNKFPGGVDVGLERNPNANIFARTSYSSYDRAAERTEQLLENKKADIVDELYKIDDMEIKIKRIVQDGIELTGYDTVNQRWIHPNGENLRKGRKKMEQAYERISQKDYDSVDHLLSDIAEFHWWAAHTMPFKRGGAAISDLITKYLLLEKGYHPSRWKEGILADIEAFHTPLEEYRTNYLNFYER